MDGDREHPEAYEAFPEGDVMLPGDCHDRDALLRSLDPDPTGA
jgi:hypothetical protein